MPGFRHTAETETRRLDLDRIEVVYEKVCTAWEPYGSLASQLPPELRERHARIYAAAIQRAREQGWNPELATRISRRLDKA
jgi:hypothetical protein